ncbi:uncharacterized protein TNIN_298451 [Trichonephila inaurata madagascariensis]|uniref:CCHC-type domain-containing protein n=1 Tax=Trichonephila inaurata madagascariensis TaxID=2747483 RepID=A0A8X6Y3W8_9ARAC|nr:uncharacterized protein TNIN_298451 [Trichonephila inaurata madagascariensis]
MAFLGRSRKDDLRMLVTELGLAPSDNLKIIELKDLITNSDRYDEEFVKDVLSFIVEERTATEKQKTAELEEKQKAVVVAQQRERKFELEKIKIQLEMQKLSQAPVTSQQLENPKLELNRIIPRFNSKKDEMDFQEKFRKPFPIKKNQPVGGSYDNHSPGPSRTVPRFPSYKTEGRNPIQCYGCGTSGVVKSKCPTCMRANEMETAVNFCKYVVNSNLIKADVKINAVVLLKEDNLPIAYWIIGKVVQTYPGTDAQSSNEIS